MAAGLTRDIKRQVVKLLFDSAEEIAEEMNTNVSQFISLLQLRVNSFRQRSLNSFYSELSNMSAALRPTSTATDIDAHLREAPRLFALDT